jgi:hypothetical protein
MREGLWLGGIVLVCAAIAGCAQQPAPLSADEAMALLRSGRAVLTCTDACLAAWREAQPQAERLAAARNWRELALMVERVGYRDDLSLYYLGKAAEGLGDLAAAASFYRQSLQVSGTSGSCKNLSGLCGGVSLPLEASLRLAAIDRVLNESPRVRRPVHAPTAAAPASAPGAEAAPPPEETAAPPMPNAVPTPEPAATDTMEYIEPPPAPK